LANVGRFPASQPSREHLRNYQLFPSAAPPRQRVAFLLWPDSSESQAHTNLRTLLHRLHGALPDTDQLLQIDQQTIAWQPGTTIKVDVAEFEEALLQADVAIQAGDDPAACAALEHAAACYIGDLLPDCYDEWVVAERERLRSLLFTALAGLARLLEQRREYGAGITYARRLVRLDPLNEAACLVLMRLHTLNGDRASALRVYHTCVSALQAELGTAPGPALRDAYERLLAAEFSPVDNILPGLSYAVVPLVGREREWAQMQAVWQVTAAGQPRLLILSGEAGIGKTRLTEELLRWGSRQGIVTAVAHCYAAEGELAYAPVMAWLRADGLRSGLTRLPVEWLSEVTRLVPELVAARPDIRPPGSMTQPWQRERLFEAVTRAVLAVDQPTMLLIDDLQWCDRDTLEWLHFLLRFNPQARLLVVGTVRIEEVESDHWLVDLLDVLGRENRVIEITLGPLNREQTTLLAEHVAGYRFSSRQAASLYNETEGNPLFVVETVRAELMPVTKSEELAHSHMSPGSSILAGVPTSVQAVIARRLGQVSPTGRKLLEVASVIGRSFTFEVLARAANVDEDTLVRGLDELWRRRIIHEQDTDSYDFTHDKLRVVTYTGLSAARRRMLHRRVARALEATPAVDLDEISGQIAAHYEQARMPAQAQSSYQRAAAFARRLYANEEAIASYQRALALMGGQSQPEIVELCDQLGEVLHFVRRYDEARDAWQRALGSIPEHNRVDRAGLYRKLGNAWRDQYHYEEALHTYDAAEAALGSLSGETDETVWLCLAHINYERINVHYWLGHPDEMLQLIEQNRPIVELHGSKVQRAQLEQISTAALLRRERYRASSKALEHARAYLQILKEAGDTDGLPAAHFQVGFGLLWADELATAEEEIGTALALAERTGDISLQGRCLTYLTVIARKQEQSERVRDYAERSLNVAIAAQMPDYSGAAHGNLAWLAWRNGELTVGRSHGQKALKAWQQLPTPYTFEWIGRWPMIGIALAEGNLVEASAHAQLLLDERQQRPPPALETALTAAVQGASIGDHESVRTALEAAVAPAQEQGYL
jgi:DNA-binding SARP family transcriptional activator